MAKTSWNDFNRFQQAARSILDAEKKTKLRYACERVLAQFVSIAETIQQKQADITLDYALTDAEGVLLTEGNNYRFKKEDAKKRDAELAALRADRFIDFEPYFATQLPDDLTEYQLQSFTGFVISEQRAKEYREAMEASYNDEKPAEKKIAAVA